MGKQRQHRSGRRFIQLWTNVKRSEAYHGLSLGARAALIEILDKYDGANNGMISMGVSELVERLRCGRHGAWRYLAELDDAGLAHPVKLGTWRARQATEWRLTFYRCDATGELPVTQWPEAEFPEPAAKSKPAMTKAERQKRHRERLKTITPTVPPGPVSRSLNAKLSVTRNVSRSATAPQTPKSSIDRNADCSARGTHVDIHHQGKARSVPPKTRVNYRKRLERGRLPIA